MSSNPRRRSRRRALARTVVLSMGATAAAGALGYVRARRLIRRARTRPDPGRDDDLGTRPGAQRRVVSFDGTELAAAVVGADRGPTLVMVHGFSGDLTLWHYQWKHFSNDYRCVMFDQRGHGQSGRAVGDDYSLDALGRDLMAVLDAEAGDGPVVLMGHSMGGMAVLALADRFPQEFGRRIQAVVLANTAASDVVKAMVAGLGARAGRLLSASALRVAARPSRVYRLRGRVLRGRGDLAYMATRLTNFGPNAPPSVVEYVAELGAKAPVEVWGDLLGSLIEMDLGDALAKITVPTLILAADVDRLTPPASAVAMKHRLPNARLVLFKGAGHCTMLERHEQFNRVVGRFLRDVVPAANEPGPVVVHRAPLEARKGGT